MFNRAYWSAQYFDPVWFAPADDSHLTPAETYRPTDAGIAPNNLRFEPIRDAEARCIRVRFGVGMRRLRANGATNAIAMRVGFALYAGRVGVVRSVAANGFAVPVRMGRLLCAVRAVCPTSDGAATLPRATLRVATRRLVVAGGAEGSPTRSQMTLRTSKVHAFGVKNPTEEELLLLVRRSFLTRQVKRNTNRTWTPRY